MDQIIFWRIILVLGSLMALGGAGLFALKQILAITGRKRLIDIFFNN